jgi:hypothetical protein
MSTTMDTCPKCGASVNFPLGKYQMKCAYCGNTITKPDAQPTYDKMQVANALFERGMSYLFTQPKQTARLLSQSVELDPTVAAAWFYRAVGILGSIGVVRFDVVGGTFYDAPTKKDCLCNL